MAIKLAGLQPEEVFTKLTATGVSDVEAAKIIGDWIIGTAIHTARTFAYQPSALANSVKVFAPVSTHFLKYSRGFSFSPSMRRRVPA